MKYTIEGFNQEEAIKYKLDLQDLIILRWLTDFFPKMSKRMINGKEFFWVKYKSLLEDFPILYIKNEALKDRMFKMVDKGILEHVQVKVGGTYSYYRFGNNYFELLKNKNSKGCGVDYRTK